MTNIYINAEQSCKSAATEPYLYLWIDTGAWVEEHQCHKRYLGIHNGKLGYKYRGSGSDFRTAISERTHDFKRIIIMHDENYDFISEQEEIILKSVGASANTAWYNNKENSWPIIQTESTKQKISKANKNPSLSTREKISESKKKLTKENRENISKGQKGKIVSEETKFKMSQAKKNMTKETREKISSAKKNPSYETRLKMSEAKKGRTLSEETREKISNTKKNMTKETREKISVSRKGMKRKPFTEEHRAKISKARRKYEDSKFYT